MSTEGVGDVVDFVIHMQPSSNLENAWLMFDQVKRVMGWTTMACHTYDVEYCKVMTIVICDMMSEGYELQMILWTSLNKVMAQHGISKPYFRGFMLDSARANWMAIRIVYGSRIPNEAIVDRECSCLLYWTTS